MPRRLQENQHIRRELLKGTGQVLVQEPNGLIIPGMTFTVDATKVAELMRYIVQGLIWHHWGVYLKRAETDIGILTARVEGDGLTRGLCSMDCLVDMRGSLSMLDKTWATALPDTKASAYNYPTSQCYPYGDFNFSTAFIRFLEAQQKAFWSRLLLAGQVSEMEFRHPYQQASLIEGAME